MKLRLKDIFDLQMGKTPSRNNPSYWGGENKWVSIADIGKVSKYIEETKENITDAGVAESGIKKVPQNTVIMSFKLSIGKTAITTEEMYTNEAIMAFIDKKVYPLDTNYFYHLCAGKDWSMGSNKAVMGLTLNKATLSEIEIDLPPIDKQKNAVSKLDFVDSLITARREQLAKLDELVKSRFVELFGDPVTNPKGWDMPLIENVVANEKNALKAGPFGSALKKEYYVSSGYKIYGQEQVISGDHTFGDYYIDEERYKMLENCAVQAGDVLISLVGTYGKLLVMPEEFEPGIINPRLMKITFDKKRVNPYYFQHYFQSDSLKKALAENTHGGTMDILNLGIVRKLAMPLPPLALQNEFISFVEQTDKSKFEIQQSLEKLETLKKALMQKYFG